MLSLLSFDACLESSQEANHHEDCIGDMNEDCMNNEVIPKQEVVVGDQLSYADEELIIRYLDKKVINQCFPKHTIHELNFFLYHPQQLSQMHDPCEAKEWYFLSPASNKYTEGGQCNSWNNDGYWEPCGTVSLIHKDDKLIGYRRTLNFIEGRHEKRTEWLMHEYRLDRSRYVRTGTTSDEREWVVCKLFKSSDEFLAAEEKEATTNHGVSSTDHTIQGPEKTNDLTDDKGPCSCLQPETDQGTSSCSKLRDQACKISSFDKPLTYSLPQHDQGTIVPPQHVQRTTVTPFTGRQATNNVVRHKCPGCKCASRALPASDQDIMMPNAESQRTGLPPPLPQNTSTGPYKANNDVVTDKGPSNSLNCDLHPLAQGLVIPRYSEKVLDEPTGICSFDGIIANPWHEDGTKLPQDGQQKVPPKLQSDQKTMVLPLSGVLNANNDEISVKHPSSDLVPKLPLVEGSPHGCHKNKAAVAPRYGGRLLYTADRLPPLDEPFESLTEEELAFFDKPDPGYPQAYEVKRPRIAGK